MLRSKLAKKVLTKKQQQHLSDMNIHSMAAFERQHVVNEAEWAKFNDSTDEHRCFHGCWDCREIAQRLGMLTRVN